jgi:FAD/FMN-containing dehydrogenase
MKIEEQLRKIIKGDVEVSEQTLEKYSRDTSLFKVRPEVVVFPKDVEDVSALVCFVNENRDKFPSLSLTGRSAGTDMTGGPLNESIIVVFDRHMTAGEVDKETLKAVVEPGLHFKIFEEKMCGPGITMPSYPASKAIAALGGMVMNNSGGERTLRYGQTRDYVEGMKVVLSDGKEYTLGPLTKEELDRKMSGQGFEGEIYRKTYELLENNFDLVQKAKPNVTKNSAGYALWRVWNRKTFDLSQLFTGSQGTLGLLTEAKLRLVKEKKHSKMITVFFDSWNKLPSVVQAVLPHEPESMETFDQATLELGLRFMPEIAKKAGEGFLRFAMRFLPEAIMSARMLEIPDLIVLIEVAEESEDGLKKKIESIEAELREQKALFRTLHNKQEEEKYWVMRRESFNLLRQHVKGKQTAPFVEDFAVRPEVLPEFLPKVVSILEGYDIELTIQGHAGNGNFHIIPLMDLTKESERAKIIPVADKVYDLVAEYGGTNTAEHNDGILRTPYLETMYGKEVIRLFAEVKNIFDPKNIFNPGKKVGGSKVYLKEHISPK